MLRDSNVSARIPAQDLARAKRFYAEKLGLEPTEERPGGARYECGGGWFALFESTGIVELAGNYPSKGGVGECGAWFKDSEGNLLSIGQTVRR